MGIVYPLQAYERRMQIAKGGILSLQVRSLHIVMVRKPFTRKVIPMSHNGNVPLVTLRKAFQTHNSAFSLYTDEETGETRAYAVYRDTRICFHITKDEVDTICQDCLNRLAKRRNMDRL